MASDYGLDDPAIEVRSLAREKDFSSSHYYSYKYNILIVIGGKFGD
jgi:hypothetical protein